MSRQPDTHKGHPSNEYYSIYVDFSFSSSCCKLGSAGIPKKIHFISVLWRACLAPTALFVPGLQCVFFK